MINFNNLPCDIMTKIMNINQEKEKDALYKNRFNIVIKQLETYSEEYEDDGDGSGLPHFLLSFKILKDGGCKRVDCRFLEDNDLWNTSYHDDIVDNYAALHDIDFDEWCDDNY
jgi:hypothetical protein